jgi:micrococcal nuclease
MRRPLLLAIVAVVAIAVAAAWQVVGNGGAGPPSGGRVVHVVDGDTIVVDDGSGRETVRLLGIDTPETVDPEKPVECYGPEASSFTKALLEGRVVELRYDRERMDMYGRWLAYVYLPGPPRMFVNAQIVERGLGRTLSIAPNLAKRDQLAALERRAALAGRGLWRACA